MMPGEEGVRPSDDQIAWSPVEGITWTEPDGTVVPVTHEAVIGRDPTTVRLYRLENGKQVTADNPSFGQIFDAFFNSGPSGSSAKSNRRKGTCGLSMLLGALGVGLVLTFAAFVWPTPWEYGYTKDLEPAEVRKNRFTGQVDYKGPIGQWHTDERTRP